MDMVRRIALVLTEHLRSDYALDYTEAARAAIEAMREPSDEMCAAMARYYDDNYRKGHEREDTPAKFIWQDMIDAALRKA